METISPDLESLTSSPLFILNPDLAAIADPQGRLLGVNPAWEAALGRVLDDLSQPGVLGLIDGADHLAFRRARNRMRHGEPVDDLVLRLRAWDQHWIHVEWRAARMGPWVYISGRVIQRRLDRETELRESEFRLSTALHGSGTGIWDWDMVRGSVYFSPEWGNMLGYAPEELAPDVSTWKGLWHPDDHGLINQAIDDYLEGKTPEYEVVHRLRHRNGTWRWVITRGMLQRSPEGTPLRWTGTNVDITDLKETQEASRKSDQRFRILFDTMPAGITLVDHEGRMVESNRAALEILGLGPEQVGTGTIDDSDWRIVRPDGTPMPPEEYASVRALREQQAIYGVEMGVYRSKDDLVWLLVNASPVPDLGIIVTYADITEIRRARELAETASKAKTEFLANMSHEIRTPLNAVIGFTELLLGTPLAPLQAEYVSNAQSAGQTLLAIINDILDFSKIEAGKLDLDPSPCDLARLLESALTMVRYGAYQKSLILQLDLDPDLPKRILIDPVRFRQIILNLLSNAVKFTSRGSVTLAVRSLPYPDPGRIGLRVRVTDTGMGISEEQQTRLFQAFSQGDTSTTRRYGGTGLGLVISQKLVKKMGSSIYLESRLGEGSTFGFDLLVDLAPAPTVPDDGPADLATGDRAASPPALEALAFPAQLSPLRLILVVDDVVMNRVLIKALLKRIVPGAEVAEAADGQEALDFCIQRRPDLVFMDVQMPVMDGISATKAIRLDEEARSLDPVPVVALTAGAHTENEVQCREAGMDWFITKPIAPQRLEEVMSQILQP